MWASADARHGVQEQLCHNPRGAAPEMPAQLGHATSKARLAPCIAVCKQRCPRAVLTVCPAQCDIANVHDSVSTLPEPCPAT
jgi:hypothetical protein